MVAWKRAELFASPKAFQKEPVHSLVPPSDEAKECEGIPLWGGQLVRTHSNAEVQGLHEMA
jgi:hypothetical protein